MTDIEWLTALNAAVESIHRDVDKFLTPFLVAGTDHSPDNMRCLREGFYGGARAVQRLVESVFSEMEEK